MIFLCSGHHTQNPGAQYPPKVEHVEALMWVDEIYNNLPKDKVVRVPARTLRQKVELINSNEASCAVEIHFNSAVDVNGNHVGRGGELLYFPGSIAGLDLAERMERYLQNICVPWRGCKEGYYRMDKNNGPDFFLAKTKCPAVIVEAEFIHRADTIDQIKPQACLAIAEALTDFINGSQC